MRRGRKVAGPLGLLIPLLVLSAAGCRLPVVLPRPSHHLAPVAEAVAGPGLSESTRALLVERGIDDVARHHPRIAFRVLEQELPGDPQGSPRRLLALAELADRLARHPAVTPSRRSEALAESRDAAVYAAFCLSDPRADESTRQAALDVHNRAVARSLRLAGTTAMASHSDWPGRLAEAGLVPTAASADWRRMGFDRLQPANHLIVSHQVDRARQKGIGVPVLARRRLSGLDAERWRPYGPRESSFAATVLVRPAPGTTPADWRSSPAEFLIQDPFRESVPGIGGGSLPLAWDLTTPLIDRLNEPPMRYYQFLGVFSSSYYMERTGIYAVDPYQPGKIPFVLLQGLWSSPDEWAPMINVLRADPVLRGRFQFWVALYPSGYAPPLAALAIRRALRDIRDRFDPQHADGALDRMVLLGKSSGGLFAKMLVQSSGQDLWDAVFARPIDQVRAAPERRDELASMFFYEPEPSIARVIFVSTGHRGSDLAEKPGVQPMERWVHAGDPMLQLRDDLIAANGLDLFRPTYRARALGVHDGLNINSPLMKAIEQTPIAPGVIYHSIMGNNRRTDDPRRMTDGVVSYASAHLDGAATERVIKMNHSSETNPEVAAEVRNILHMHLNGLR